MESDNENHITNYKKIKSNSESTNERQNGTGFNGEKYSKIGMMENNLERDHLVKSENLDESKEILEGGGEFLKKMNSRAGFAENDIDSDIIRDDDSSNDSYLEEEDTDFGESFVNPKRNGTYEGNHPEPRSEIKSSIAEVYEENNGQNHDLSSEKRNKNHNSQIQDVGSKFLYDSNRIQKRRKSYQSKNVNFGKDFHEKNRINSMGSSERNVKALSKDTEFQKYRNDNEFSATQSSENHNRKNMTQTTNKTIPRKVFRNNNSNFVQN